MPEGPEVRRYADAIGAALMGKPLARLTARTRLAKQWLHDHPDTLCGRRVQEVRSHGKNLVGLIEGGFYFYSHLMMWGRWEVIEGDAEIPADRRERARIVVPDAAAILLSAPVFEVGAGEPYAQIEYLRRLGPDVLPYAGREAFDAKAFLARLALPEHRERTIGAALLDQTIAAGLGNYLRAEVLFACRLDPWRRVEDLTEADLDCLRHVIPDMAAYAYQSGGATASETDRVTLRSDERFVYQPGREYGTRHYVFRRTNLPCVRCGDIVRQKRQITWQDEEGEKERIIYFCPTCQQTSVPLHPPRRKGGNRDKTHERRDTAQRPEPTD